MLLGLDRVAMAGGKKSYDVHDYVGWGTSDLVAMWDGIRNVGATAAHSATTTVWKDIVGSCDLTSKTSYAYHVDADSFRWEKGASLGNSAASDLYALVTGGGAFTVEVVFKVTSSDNVNGSLFGIGNNRSFWMFVNTGTSFQCDRFDNYDVVNYGEGRMNEILSVSFSNGSIYGNGSPNGTTNQNTRRRTGTSSLQIGRLPSFGDGMVGSHYCIRVYGRALSEREIAANYAVDAARFGLT